MEALPRERTSHKRLGAQPSLATNSKLVEMWGRQSLIVWWQVIIVLWWGTVCRRKDIVNPYLPLCCVAALYTWRVWLEREVGGRGEAGRVEAVVRSFPVWMQDLPGSKRGGWRWTTLVLLRTVAVVKEKLLPLSPSPENCPDLPNVNYPGAWFFFWVTRLFAGTNEP